MMKIGYGSMVEAARHLRKRMTWAEKRVWEVVRDRRLAGYKFNRQHPISVKYEYEDRWVIADFYCAGKKLILELDGSYHDDRTEIDALRDGLLTDNGYRVLRFRNEMTLDQPALKSRLAKEMVHPTPAQPHSPSTPLSTK